MYSVVATGRNSLTTHRMLEGLRAKREMKSHLVLIMRNSMFTRGRTLSVFEIAGNKRRINLMSR